MPPLGFRHSKETKAKISVAHIGIPRSKKTKEKIAIALRGRKAPWLSMRNKHNNPIANPESKAKMIESLKRRFANPQNHPWFGRSHSIESRQRMSAIRKGRHTSPQSEFKKGNIPWDKGVSRPDFAARYGKKEEFEQKKFKNMRLKPTKPELILDNFLNSHFPNQWKYVGNGELVIGGLNPDFINKNGKKEVIELFGTYWHPMFDVAKKKEHYLQYGFRVAVIWEDELKNEERLLKVLRRKFN